MNGCLILLVFLPFLMAVFACFVGEKRQTLRQGLVIFSCFVSFVLSLLLLFASFENEMHFTLGLFSFRVGDLQAVYGLVTSFMWLCAAMLSPQYFKGHHHLARYDLFFLLTLGATLGVFYSADLITTFTFFEVMSLTSYAWVVQEEDKEAMAAGKTYLTVAVLGGMVCLMGLFLLYHLTGTLQIAELSAVLAGKEKTPMLYVAAFCMLFGFGAKAGMFPLHIWLPKAHPVAPAPASALLSGVLTKTGVFGILVITTELLAGDPIWNCTLLLLATITMVLGAVLAVFSINLKRTLACSSLSQIGFILVGVSMISFLGEENALAANGTLLYMLNHSLVKLVLFLSAGAIYLGAHTLDLNKLRGYGRKRPLLMICFLIGACSLAGIPGMLGYLSKTLVHESIVEYAHHAGFLITLVEWLFLFSGGLTAAYMTKLFVAIFVEKPTEDTPKGKKLSPLSSAALVISALALPLIGVTPHLTADPIADFMAPFVDGHEMHHAVAYFSFVNLKGVLISLSIGAAVYFLVIRTLLMKKVGERKVYINPWKEEVSLENLLYLPLIRLFKRILGFVCRILDGLLDAIIPVGIRVFHLVSHFFADLGDLLILLLSKTLFREAREPEQRKRRKYIYALGRLFALWNHDEVETSTQNLMRVSDTLSRTTKRITQSFSFSMLMTCIGICVILLALLLMLFL